MPRTILLDANVIDQLNRGNLYVARALKTLLASNAKVYMSMQGYKELTSQPGKFIAGIGPDLPRVAVANKKLLKDLGITVARKGSFGNRVTVYERNAIGKTLSDADQMIVAQAKAMNAEVWSFDPSFRKDPKNIAAFGVKVAPESQLPFEAQTKGDYRVGRRVMNLKPTPITVGGEIKPRGKPGAGLKGAASTTPAAVTQSGVIETKAPKASPPSAVVGSRSTEGAARGLAPKTWSSETKKRPSSASQLQRLSASSARSAIKGKALDLKKIRKSAVKALKPRIGAAKNLAKGVGKGLVVGVVVGLLESYLFNKLAGWLLKDEGVKRLNELDKRKGPEIERRVQKAVEDHVRKLERVPGVLYKIVLEFRLVNHWVIGDIYLPDDLLIDKVSVTESFWTKREECIEAKVTSDVTEVTYVGREGEVRLHKSEDLFQVFKCTRILDFDFPDVGEPSLEGEWEAFFIDKNGPYKKHLATYTITSSGNEKKPRIFGINSINNQKLQIWDVEWTGRFLEFKVKHDKYTKHISMSFKEWDVLTGWLNLIGRYSHLEPSSPIRWERIAESEKQL